MTKYAYINAEASRENASRAVQYLTAIGFELVAVRPAEPWEGQAPQTLIIARIEDKPHYSTLIRSLNLYCELFAQDSAALLPSNGKGVLLGRNPQSYVFNPQYFSKS